MSDLRYTLSSLLYVNNVDSTVDFDNIGALPADVISNIDIAVEGYADFISGTYQEDPNDPNNFLSTVTVNDTKVKQASYRLISGLTDNVDGSNDFGFTGFTAFGDVIKTQGNRLVGANLKGVGTYGYATSGLDFFVDLNQYNGENSSVITSNKIQQGKGGLGPVLVQTVSAALFKSLGRTAALLNDTTISGKESGLATDIDDAWSEINADSSNTKYFTRYIDSGRFYDDSANGVTSGDAVNYNFTNATFDFVVQLQGTLTDSDGGITLNNSHVSRIFGTPGTDTKLSNDGDYTMNIFVRLQQKDDLN